MLLTLNNLRQSLAMLFPSLPRTVKIYPLGSGLSHFTERTPVCRLPSVLTTRVEKGVGGSGFIRHGCGLVIGATERLNAYSTLKQLVLDSGLDQESS